MKTNTYISDSIIYVGASSYEDKLFEAHFEIPNGMAYNSYLILDDKVALVDAVDKLVVADWLENIKDALKGRNIDYLIVQHVEPDHTVGILEFLKIYPDVTIVGSEMTFRMLSNYFRDVSFSNKLIIKENDVLSLGKHHLKFIFAPMVHWPEVFVSYESYEKILFSADAFGKFGALDKDEDWTDEARRYYFGIVGKYGMQVQALFNKLASLDIKKICSLHGPIIEENLAEVLDKYKIWATYNSEVDGVFIPYTSVYGNTEKVVFEIKSRLEEKGVQVEISNLSRDDFFSAVSNCFKYSKIIFATTTYNMSIFPYMNELLTALSERNFQNKKVGIIENGSWAPTAGKIIKDKLSLLKNIEIVEPIVHIVSSRSEKNELEIAGLVEKLTN